MILVFIVLFLFMMIGVPVAFSILSSGITYLLISGENLLLVSQRLIYGVNSFTLLAVPLFIFVGNLMNYGGISKRLTDWATSLLGWLPGGLGIVTVFSCAIFASLTGSGPATVAAIGAIMLPSMIEQGYDKRDATGIIVSAGALGPIIPPSIPMIVYGVTMNLSIPAMFLAGVVPGLVIMISLSVLNVIKSRKQPEIMKNAKKMNIDMIEDSFKLFWKALGALGLPVVILGGIYGGVFTPTEAAAVGVVYALILGFATKELRLRQLPKILLDSLKTSTMVNFIIASASLFSYIIAKSRVGILISNAFISFVGESQTIYLLSLVIILVFVGCLMDNIAATMILAPILIPVGLSMGLHELHLGVLFTICLVIGFVTPPFGYNLFTGISISGLSFAEVVKGSLPYLLTEIVLLFLFAFFPEIILILPRMTGFV